MPHTNMELPALPVQLAMLEAAGTIFATKVSLGQTWDFLPRPQLLNILYNLTLFPENGLPSFVWFS